MQVDSLSFQPSLSVEVAEKRMANLLLPGEISDRALEIQISRLDNSFHRYATGIPHGLWAPGLVITREMRAIAELHFPMEQILPLFTRFFSGAMAVKPFPGASSIHKAHSWPDALQSLQSLVKRPNPAELLSTLMVDEQERRRFFFLNFLQERYGGCFNRYPGQIAFLGEWLRKNRDRFAKEIYCLDAACGCGEGAYDLAALLLAGGFHPETFHISGSTIEPFELFASAHIYFPHDLKRQYAYRRHLEPLFAQGACNSMIFNLENITGTPTADQRFDVILCNGIFGGPFINGQQELEKTAVNLAQRLRPGGILLAADRFHGDWKKKAPEALLAKTFMKAGLDVSKVEEGLVGVKTG